MHGVVCASLVSRHFSPDLGLNCNSQTSFNTISQNIHFSPLLSFTILSVHMCTDKIYCLCHFEFECFFFLLEAPHGCVLCMCVCLCRTEMKSMDRIGTQISKFDLFQIVNGDVSLTISLSRSLHMLHSTL